MSLNSLTITFTSIILIAVCYQAIAQEKTTINRLEKRYTDFSPLSQYLYDSAYYESARQPAAFEYATFVYASNGVEVEAFMCHPKNLESKKWPVIIYNRGGTGNYGKLTDEIFPYFLELAQHGFLVVGSNYRFVGEQGKYDQLGGDDVKDLNNLVELVKA